MYKVSIIFAHKDGNRNAGFTENFYNNGDNLENIKERTRKLVVWLEKLKGAQTGAAAVRYSQLPKNNRQLGLFRFPHADNQQVSATQGSDYPTTALLLRLRGGAYATSQWIKGIQDDVIVKGGEFVVAGDYQTAVNGLITELCNGNNEWSIYAQNKNTPHVDIITVSPIGVCACGANHGLQNGDKTRISGALAPKELNKVWKVFR